MAGMVLASAGVGGAFPARPELPSAPSAGVAESEAADGAKKDAETVAEVEDEPEPALGLTHGQRELVQNGLVWLGYEIGRVDGVLGRRSQAAIRAYQEEKGLASTGRLTAEVSEALQVLGKRQVERVRAAENKRKEAEEARRRQAEAERREGERALREPGRRFRDCDGTWCPEVVVVPSGSYMMGSPESEAGREDDEGPRHRVRIAKPFAVGVYEVTRVEFGRFVRETGHSTSNACWTYEGGKWEERSGRSWRTPGFNQAESHPVVCVSWEDAQAYVRWLSGETGESYRLLSESEWEYVARAGTTGPFHFGATLSTAQANYDGNYTYGSGRKGRYRERTEPVGSFPANAYGVHDVHGNVWEWVEDCWHDGYGGAPGDGRAWTVGGGLQSPGVAGRLVVRRSAEPAFRASLQGPRRDPGQRHGFPSCQDVGLSPALSPGSLLLCLLWGPGGISPLVDFFRPGWSRIGC